MVDRTAAPDEVGDGKAEFPVGHVFHLALDTVGGDADAGDRSAGDVDEVAVGYDVGRPDRCVDVGADLAADPPDVPGIPQALQDDVDVNRPLDAGDLLDATCHVEAACRIGGVDPAAKWCDVGPAVRRRPLRYGVAVHLSCPDHGALDGVVEGGEPATNGCGDGGGDRGEETLFLLPTVAVPRGAPDPVQIPTQSAQHLVA